MDNIADEIMEEVLPEAKFDELKDFDIEKNIKYNHIQTKTTLYTERLYYEIITSSNFLKKKPADINNFFKGNPNNNEINEYLQYEVFNYEYSEVILSDGSRGGYKVFKNGIEFWLGSYVNRRLGLFSEWWEIRCIFYFIFKFGNLLANYSNKDELIKAAKEYEVKRGSCIEDSKYRISTFFNSESNIKKCASMLKQEYGIGGSSGDYIVIRSSDHNSKGISLEVFTRPFNSADYINKVDLYDKTETITISWEETAKIIRELIDNYDYLYPEEIPGYQKYCEERGLIPMKTKKEPLQCDYKVGDTVYVGEVECEIMEINKDNVKLFDTSFPILPKILNIEDFEDEIFSNKRDKHLIKTA